MEDCGLETIGEMAGLYGISLRTLRFYEYKGLLQPVRVGSTRFYTARDRVRLELILKGKRFGFTLEDIMKLIGGRPDQEGTGAASDVTLQLDRDQILAQLTVLGRRREIIVGAIEELQSALQRLA